MLGLIDKNDQYMEGNWTFGKDVEVQGILTGGGIGYKGAGDEYYVDPINGDDGMSGKTPGTAKASLLAAYNLLTANQNDVIYFLGGGTSDSLSAAFTWAKNYTHLVGVTPPLRNGGRARISMGADMSTMFTISATGCSFKRIHWQYGRGTGTNLTGVSVTGDRNYFEWCDFEGPLHATEAAAAFKVLNLASGAQDNHFVGGRIGSWTIQANMSSGYLVNFAGNNAVCSFENVLFQLYSTSTASEFINAGVNFGGEAALLLIKDCTFEQLDNDKTLTRAIVPPTTGICHVCGMSSAFNVTDWCDAGNAHLYVSVPASNEAGGIATVTS